MSRRGLGINGLVSLAGGGLNAATNIVLAALLGHHLAVEGAGEFFKLVAVFVIVANILELGADTGLVRFTSAAVAGHRRNELNALVSVALGPVCAVGVTSAAVVCLTAPGIADLLGLGLGGTTLIRVMAVCSVIAALTMVLLGAARGLSSALSYTVIQNVLLPLSRLILIAVVLRVGGGLNNVMVAWLTPLFVTFALTVVLVVRLLRRHSVVGSGDESGAIRRGVRGQFWRFSSARGVAAAVEILLEWVDVLIVAALLSTREAGVYAVVTRCARAGELVQQAVRLALGARLSSALSQRYVDEVARINRSVSALMVLGAWPCYMFAACFAPIILSLFGPGFETGAPALAVLCLGMGLATAAGSAQTILLMGGRSSHQLANKSAMLALNVALNLILVPRVGITGAAIAWAACILLDTLLIVWQVRGLGVIAVPRELLRPATLSIALSAVLCSTLAVIVGPGGADWLGSDGETARRALVLLVVLLVYAGATIACYWLARGWLGVRTIFKLPHSAGFRHRLAER
ncbi:polysaccharide biosynthesis C-terminal domain-containing protein [Kribbella sp. NBC_01245]|uniref:lipopolysaccharide biosynthesis protein n=1 Tax=Kribbella sp. NBC_01245 TaxID=2903578 RepID=UPI002E2D4374|nr:polysaccharide biosynthesis C-terminal domain-containing protein [Kribbella sp. NBC_01245]